MRGKGTCDRCPPRGRRITPARAGKSRPAIRAASPSWDHPRACGEKKRMEYEYLKDLGSPPRVRGKAGGSLLILILYGITPARAGKRCRFHRSSADCRDHPRACGEKRSQIISKSRISGSPPRVRGKVDVVGVIIRASGITPARAGKRGLRASPPRGRGDHPRACGEKDIYDPAEWDIWGSPPRVRGKGHLRSG